MHKAVTYVLIGLALLLAVYLFFPNWLGMEKPAPGNTSTIGGIKQYGKVPIRTPEATA